jgi:hypothetical protein
LVHIWTRNFLNIDENKTKPVRTLHGKAKQEKGGETMIKKLTKSIRNYRLNLKKARHHKRWAQLLHSGLTVRDHKTLVTITDDEMIVDYMDGRSVGQKYVNPIYIDTTNWGR